MKRSTVTCLFLTLFFLAPAVYGQHFSAWSAPVNTGPLDNTGTALLARINTALPEAQPFLSKDGLSLYFVRLPGGNANDPGDIFVAKRSSQSDSWGEPQPLGPAINTPANENSPFVTIDGHWMYFSSARITPDANGVSPMGKTDIYVTRRHNKREDFPDQPSGGWQEPVNLGSGVNTAYGERSPMVFEDEETGVTTLYFDSNRPGLGGFDIYASTLQPDGTFGPAVLVAELSSPYSDERPRISRDGLEMYFISDRPGSSVDAAGVRWADIWVSTRASTLDPWGTPENLDVVNARMGGPAINTLHPYHDQTPALSFDGTVLYFASGGRPEDIGGLGWLDIWMSTREKLTGNGNE